MSQTCCLKPLQEEDFPNLLRLFSCPDTRKYLGGPVANEIAKERAKAWIRQSSNKEPIWSVRRSRDQAFLGYILLDDHHNGTDTEISYALLPESWGHGYATCALRESCTHARNLGIKRLVAETQAKNQRSIRLLQRIGMTEDNRLTRFGEDQIIFRIEFPTAVQ